MVDADRLSTGLAGEAKGKNVSDRASVRAGARRRLLWALVPAATGLALMGWASPAVAATTAGSASAMRAVHPNAAKPARPYLTSAPRLSPASTVTPGHTFTVNTTADTVDATPGDQACADSTGKCSLRAAVMEADADTGLVQINVPAGTYALSIVAASPDDASTGDLNLTNTTGGIRIVGAGPGTTRVDGSAVSDRVFEIGGSTGDTAPALISGLTVRGGNTGSGNGFGYNGSGVLVNNTGAATLAGDTVTDNAAEASSGRGGGVDNEGSLWLESSTLSANTAAYGGGLYNDNLANVNGTTFSANTAMSSGGGVYDNYPLVMSNSVMTGNGASAGGGLYDDDNTNLSAVTLSHNMATTDGGGADLQYPVVWNGGTVIGNSSPNGGGLYNGSYNTYLNGINVTGNQATTDGGGIYNENSMTLNGVNLKSNVSAGMGGGLYNIDDVTYNGGTISANMATVEGGGIYNDDYAGVAHVTVSGNAAPAGGGIYNDSNLLVDASTLTANKATGGDGGALFTDSTAQLTNDTLTGNAAIVPVMGAGGHGGAIASEYQGTGTSPVVDLSATEVTINANTSGGSGGGFYNSGAGNGAVFRSSVLSNNRGHFGQNNCVNSGPAGLSGGFNLDSGSSCRFASFGDQSNANPHLGLLASNGGPTQTEALMPGSAAINAGGLSCPTATDQRGVARPQGPACDVGAYELKG